MAVIRMSLTQDSEAQLKRLIASPERAATELRQALKEILVGLESHVKIRMDGGNPRAKRNGQLPLANRSGALAQSITHELDGPLSGFYGSAAGPASAYARTQLGAGTTTIRPKNAKHLWIPIADNLTPGGRTRMTPSEAFEQKGPRGGSLLSIFKSGKGNLVAFLREASGKSRRLKSGKNKGRLRGRLLFVLKDEVTIKGTDALRVAWNDREGWSIARMERGLATAIEGDVA